MKYDIIASGTYYNKEVIDTATSIKEACYLLKEYRLAFGNSYIIYYKKKGR